ncbi:MAG: hypothetical protein AB7R55_10380 [Gemmatimonadales bacterium]
MTALPLVSPATPATRLPPDELRRALHARFPEAVLLPERSVPPLVTGFAPLDRLLPNGGLPRGRLVVWRGQGGGATAILRTTAMSLLARGERVAWIDGRRVLSDQWADGPLVIRPRDPELAFRAAEILLRSGGFALVVLAGADPDSTATLRLTRMAHEGGGGFVAVTDRTFTASLRIESRYLIEEFERSVDPFGDLARLDRVALRIEARAPGWQAHTTLRLPLSPFALRMALDPELPDRRGRLDQSESDTSRPRRRSTARS